MTATANGRLDPQHDAGSAAPAGAGAADRGVGGAEAIDGCDPAEPESLPADVKELAARTLERATTQLLSQQDDSGWWKGNLETNVTMDAEDLLLREFLGIRTAEVSRQAGDFIRSQQREDGTWATFRGGPGELSTTVEAYVALKLAGDDPDAPHMARAAAWIRERGGIARTRVFTRIWLALFGWYPWDRLPEMPPELIFLPRWVPLNIYSFASWARGTIVPLTVVSALRPVRPGPFPLAELHSDPYDPFPPQPFAAVASWDGFFQRLDRALHLYHHRNVRPLRRLALKQAAAWIVERQEKDGCWGGIQPPAVYSLIALHLLGYDLEHPVIKAGLSALERYTARDAEGRRYIEACQSPVWDTCLATIALADGGLPADHPALVKAVDWLLDEEITRRGDWAVQRPALPAGGWAFEFHNDTYPDTDDSAEVLLALRRVAHPEPERVADAVRRGVEWTLGMQSRNGAWGAFDADNDSPFPNRLPFCDFGEVIDPPSADVTAHVVELLADVGKAQDPRTRRGVAWLLDEQEPDGSWFGRWGANYVYGVGSVVPALIAAGIPASHVSIRRAVSWLLTHQNDDGGWGEDLRSYVDRDWSGRGESTASQTAWALLALLAAGERGEPVERAVTWLAETQLPSGTWDEPQFTGTGFPGDFYINYNLYRLVWPITALGRYLHGTGVGSPAGASGR